MPISLQARMTRTAISPLLATSTFENTFYRCTMSSSDARSAKFVERFGQIRHVDHTTSTNADLVAAARSGAPEQFLHSDFQSQGKGRLGRTWQAPPRSSVLMSALVRPALDPSLVPWLGAAMGVATVKVVSNAGAANATLKWPNDVVVESPVGELGYLKLAGVLSELVSVNPTAVVVGVGCNIDFGSNVPVEIAQRSTSLAQLGVDTAEHTIEQVAQRIAERFVDHLDQLERSGPANIRSLMQQCCSTIGRRVRVELGDGRFVEGTASGIADNMALRVDAHGESHVFNAGDIVHLR